MALIFPSFPASRPGTRERKGGLGASERPAGSSVKEEQVKKGVEVMEKEMDSAQPLD